MEADMIGREAILYLTFGCLGFFLCFFVARTVNIALLLLMVWVPLKVIEKYGFAPDWEGFNNLKESLLSIWSVLADLISNMLTIAPTGSLVLFLIGGLTGFVMNMKARSHH